MAETSISRGSVHPVPKELRTVLLATPKMREAWEDITPLARNEWICWITSAKKEETKQERLRRTKENLLGGKRRPCCWAGCPHR